MVSGCHGRVGAGGPASARHTSSRIKATATQPAGSFYAAGAFGIRSPNGMTSGNVERRVRVDRSPFDPVMYRRRNVIERCVNKLKQWRGIATRYEKRAVNYRAMVVVAALMPWLAA